MASIDSSNTSAHGFHEGCTCAKCSQRFTKCKYVNIDCNLKAYINVVRKEEKEMLQEYNEKLSKMLSERDAKIKELCAANKMMKECREYYYR